MRKSIRNFFKFLICFIIILPITFVSVACSGSNGKSAYELAVENGFVGTLEEWLESLKGTNGSNGKDKQSETSYHMWEKAKQEGSFTGTYLEFLETYFLYDDTSYATNKALSCIVEISAGSMSGSGVIYNIDSENDAFIITNYHVVYGCSTCTVKLYGTNDSDKFTATVIGGSSTYDLAILYVKNQEILETAKATATTINTITPLVGSTCIAIGNTGGNGTSTTKGVIRKETENLSYTIGNLSQSHRLLAHNAYMMKGNSGGGLFNVYGELIGITNCGIEYKDGTDDSGLKYAIPASIVYSVTENIIQNCFNSSNKKVILYDLGLTFVSKATREINQVSGLTETIDIVTISAISSSNYTKLQTGDKLISFKFSMQNETLIEKQVIRHFDLDDYLPLLTEDCTIELIFDRNGQTITQTISCANLNSSTIV